MATDAATSSALPSSPCRLKIVAGADDFGCKLKDALVTYLRSLPGVDVQDLGTGNYYSIGEEVGRLVSQAAAAASPDQPETRGLVACGTGVGVAIFANKFPRVYAATCESVAEAVNTRSSETTILQAWQKGPNNTKRITAAGFRVIVSSSDFYYLDCGHGGFVGNDSRYDRQVGDDPAVGPFNFAGGNGGSWCAPFKTWQRIYDYDITYGLSEGEAALVLGGEVALWSERADTTVLDSWV